MKKNILFTFLILLLNNKSFFAQTGVITTTIIQQPCNNDGMVAFSISGLTAPYTIQYQYDYNFSTNHTVYNVFNSNDTIKYIPALRSFGAWLNPGTFYLNINVTDNLGIISSASVLLNSPFYYTVNTTPAACPIIYGTGSVNFSAVSTYSVEWGTAWQTPFNSLAVGNPASLLVGDYDVRVTDLSTGCAVRSYSTFAYVNSISGMSYSPTVVPANCTNGSISLSNPVGGIAPYAYHWSNGATTSSIGGIIPNTYTVGVTDSQGCTEPIYYINVPQATTLTLNTTVSNASCLQPDGSIMAFPTGGTAPYNFLWTNGNTTAMSTNLPAGGYNVIVTDNNGCLGSFTNIYVGSNTPITVTYTASASSCTLANGSATITPIGGTAPYTVTWSTFPITTGLSIANLPLGTYYFNVVDAVGCVRSGSVYIPPVSVINANISTANAVCPALLGNAYANVSGTNPPFTYVWNNGATTNSILNTNIGSYNCVITDAQQCSVTKYGYINQVSSVNVSMYSTPASCVFASDGSATANATGGTGPYVYSWSDGQIGASATSLASTNYYVNVSDVNGCSNGSFVNIGYNAANTSCYCIISGNVYNDVNSNCIQDVGELGIQNQMIHCPPYGYTYTDANGNYSFKVPSGTYTVSEIISGNYLFAGCQSSSSIINAIASAGCTHIVNFANTVIPIHDVQIVTTSANIPPVVGNPYTQRIIVQNNGTITESNVQIGYVHDGQLMCVSNSSNLLTQQNSISYPNWYSQNAIPSIAPNSSVVIDLNYNVPATIPIGTSLSFYDTTSFASPIVTNWLMDNTPWNNVNTYQTSVIASYDPNYKEVMPKGFTALGLIAPKDSILNYVVHFQNEGSYFAQNIIVIDTLDADLDWTSLKPGYSNHNFSATISESGVLTYTFKNINLPWKQYYGDAMSSGLFSYSIKTKRNLALGTQFINGAAIYFDYNAPVITNKTLNTLGDASVGIKNSDRTQTDETILFPNPTNGLVTLNSSNEILKIELYTITGQVLLSESVNSKSHQLQLQKFTDGIYFLRVQNKNTNKTIKIIKQ